MTNIAKIRAALEFAKQCELGLHIKCNEALAALAELERAAAPQFVAGVVTDDVAARVLTHFSNFPVRLSNAQNGHDMIAAVRSELGPTLGLVELKEPTPEECRDIWREAKANEGDGSKVCAGRAMFDACRAVMWPKEGL